MKPINRDRTTRVFCIHGYTVRDMVAIAKKYGTDLVAVAQDKEDLERSVYRIRVMVGNGLIDYTVRVSYDQEVVETERHVVIPDAGVPN